MIITPDIFSGYQGNFWRAQIVVRQEAPGWSMMSKPALIGQGGRRSRPSRKDSMEIRQPNDHQPADFAIMCELGAKCRLPGAARLDLLTLPTRILRAGDARLHPLLRFDPRYGRAASKHSFRG